MDATHPNAEGTLLQVKDPSSARSVIVEDDGRVAYAYLLDGKEIIADVWLYNVAPTPDESDWKDRSQDAVSQPARLLRQRDGSARVGKFGHQLPLE